MSAAGARAAALAAARVLGGATIAVRLPSPPLPAADTEQLGLPSPEFHDVTIAPCVVRVQRDGSLNVLIAAGTLEGALGVSDATGVKQALFSAALVQVAGESLLLRDVQSPSIYGRAYLYRLLLRHPQAEVRG